MSLIEYRSMTFFFTADHGQIEGISSLKLLYDVIIKPSSGARNRRYGARRTQAKSSFDIRNKTLLVQVRKCDQWKHMLNFIHLVQ